MRGVLSSLTVQRAIFAGCVVAGSLALEPAAATVPASAKILRESIAIPSETPYDRALDAIALREFSQALNLLRIASAAGDVRADLLLADYFDRGLGLPRNEVEARRSFERAAARGSAAARAMLVVMNMRSDGVKATAQQNLNALRALAEAGEPVAQREWALILLEGRTQALDTDAAVAWLHRAAGAGDARAQGIYGQLFLLGQGVNVHPPTAIYWLKQGAEKDDPLAQYVLGTVFRDGRVVEQDVIEGAYWLDRAATQGWTAAQWALAQMYARGGALNPNPQLARRWLLAAARGGQAEAQLRLGVELLERGGSVQDRTEGQRWLQQAALKGLKEAQQILNGLEPLNTGSRK